VAELVYACVSEAHPARVGSSSLLTPTQYSMAHVRDACAARLGNWINLSSLPMPINFMTTDQPASGLKTNTRIVWLLLKFSIAAIFISLPIRWFVAEQFIVSGNSMVPTLTEGNYLVIDKLTYHVHKPERGDVIIMRYPLDPSIYFLKRVIGLPGETINDTNGIITIVASSGKSTMLHEPYMIASTKKEQSITTLASDEYFVLGDNRSQSSDSRDWGPLQDKFIVGRAFVRLLPLNEMEILPGQQRFPAVQ
jgi:signal peptidase I